MILTRKLTGNDGKNFRYRSCNEIQKNYLKMKAKFSSLQNEKIINNNLPFGHIELLQRSLDTQLVLREHAVRILLQLVLRGLQQTKTP